MSWRTGPDLPWQAFRYVAGEMSCAETAEFEARLERDQAVREAVAAAVELAGAVVAAGPGSSLFVPLRRRTPRWVLGVASASAAACLGAVLLWHHRTPAPAAPGREPSQIVALTWSGLHQAADGAPNASIETLALLDDVPMPLESDVRNDLERAETTDLALPLWLVEAASLRGQSSAAGPEIQEN